MIWARGAHRRVREALGLLPEFFGNAAGADVAAEVALEPQPAVPALFAELPAGQDRLDPRNPFPLLERAVEEGEGQQHPWPCQGRALLRCGEAIEADGAEALG